MRTRFRRPVAALASAALILSLASPAGAFIRDEGDRKNSVPIVFDVLLLRPLGFLMTLGGAALYVFPVAPVTALTRPSDITKPLGPLVAQPGKFTFGDPLGYHP